MSTIEEIREAAGRLHSTAWHGRKAAVEAASKVTPPAGFVARFSIPRQPTDDDEVVYAAIEELAALRKVAEAAKKILVVPDCDDRCQLINGGPACAECEAQMALSDALHAAKTLHTSTSGGEVPWLGDPGIGQRTSASRLRCGGACSRTTAEASTSSPSRRAGARRWFMRR
jgi:hypothetical protein